MSKPTLDEIFKDWRYSKPRASLNERKGWFKKSRPGYPQNQMTEAEMNKIKTALTELNKQVIENYLTKVYGKRCESKDIDDAPDLKESGNNRCLTCKVWEHYDLEVKYGGKSHEQ